MSDVKLLECPFCGCEMRRDYNGAAFVHPAADSSPCPARYVEGYTDEDITAWNTRANLATGGNDPPPVELRDWLDERDDDDLEAWLGGR